MPGGAADGEGALMAARPLQAAWLAAAALAALALAAPACHFDRDTNAPGLSDVATAPRDLSRHQPEPPADPGEEMIALTPGLMMGGGVRGRSPHGFGDFGVEIGLNQGENPRSHREDDFLVYPLSGRGVILGWSFLRLDDDSGGTRARIGPLYLEGQMYRQLTGGGLGVAVDPRTGATGPELNVWFWSLFARTRYLWGQGGGFEATFGWQLKIPVTWVHSR